VPEGPTGYDLAALELAAVLGWAEDAGPATPGGPAPFAALGGLLGSGPLSDSSAQAGPLRLDYGRFERRHAPEALDIEVDGGVASDGRVELWLSTDYLDGIELQSVVPEPVEVVTAGDRTVFAFVVGNPDEPTTVRFALEHDEVGVADGRIGVGGGPELAFWQVVYP